MLQKKIQTYFKEKGSLWILFLVLLVFGISSIIRLFLFGDTAFGYDTGIYRHIIYSFSQLAGTPALAFSYFSNSLISIGFSVDAIAYGWYIGIGLLCIFLLYLFVRSISNRRIANFAAIYFAGSFVYLQFFLSYYYRNLLALFFALVCFLCLYLPKPWRLVCLLFSFLFLISIHPIIALQVLGTFLYIGIMERAKYPDLLPTIMLATIIALGINIEEFFRYITTLLNTTGAIVSSADTSVSDEYTGQFLSFSSWVRVSLPLLPFSIIGILRLWKNNQYLIICGIISFILYIIRIPFYTRLLIILLLPIVVSAAFGIDSLIEKKRRVLNIFLYGYSFLLLLAGFIYVILSPPSFSQSDIINIQKIKTFVAKEDLLLLYNSADAPWVLGFSGHPYDNIVAPGVFDANIWTFDDWQLFWTSPDVNVRKELIYRYDRSVVFFYINPTNLFSAKNIFVDDPYIHYLGNNLWRYNTELQN